MSLCKYHRQLRLAIQGSCQCRLSCSYRSLCRAFCLAPFHTSSMHFRGQSSCLLQSTANVWKWLYAQLHRLGPDCWHFPDQHPAQASICHENTFQQPDMQASMSLCIQSQPSSFHEAHLLQCRMLAAASCAPMAQLQLHSMSMDGHL